MFYGSGYILRLFLFFLSYSLFIFFSILRALLIALYMTAIGSGNVIAFKNASLYRSSLSVPQHVLFFTIKRIIWTHARFPTRLPWSEYFFFFCFSILMFALLTWLPNAAAAPPRGDRAVKDPWARLLLMMVTTSLPACPLFYDPKTVVVVIIIFLVFGTYFFFISFPYRYYIIAVRIGTYLTTLKIRRTHTSRVRTTT